MLLNGKRVNACLTLAVMCDGADLTTIEGLASGEDLHPMQQAFIKHDAFQCGYCTPGQICSAVGLAREGRAHDTAQIQELMSRPVGDVLDEAQRLVKSGVKELLVISQDTSAYGVDVKYRTGFWNGAPVKTRMTELCEALSSL